MHFSRPEAILLPDQMRTTGQQVRFLQILAEDQYETTQTEGLFEETIPSLLAKRLWTGEMTETFKRTRGYNHHTVLSHQDQMGWVGDQVSSLQILVDDQAGYGRERRANAR